MYACTHLQNTSQDDGNDEPVDGNSLTEDDRDQILGLDARGTDTTANNAHTSSVDAPREKSRRISIHFDVYADSC